MQNVLSKEYTRQLIANAIKSTQLEKPNWKPSAVFLKDLDAYVEGYITADEVIEGIYNRHRI